MELYVARQPIFDAHTNVTAYELLYRSGTVNAFDGSDPNAATSKVITASFYSPAGREIIGGRPAFINFPRSLLVSGGGAVLPPGEIVIEILESVQSDAEVESACRTLRAHGYKLALDDFMPGGAAEPLAALVDYIKVDFQATTPAEQEHVVHKHGRTASLLAEKVETHDEFRRAMGMGYKLFQGYFFARPMIVSTREIPGFKLNRLRILQQLHLADMDFRTVSELIRREAALSYKLLRFVNSALFNVRQPIESIQQATSYIGESGMRRWLPVVILADLNSGGPGELAVNALVRARLCESLAPAAELGSRSSDLFLLGLFSHLDAMYGRPMEEVLSGLNLCQEISETLLGRPRRGSRLAAVWSTVTAYERGCWEQMVASAEAAGIAPGEVPAHYAAAAKWAEVVVRGNAGSGG